MQTRILVGYALFALLVAAGIFAARWMIRNSERNVRRRERRERRARYKAGLADQQEAESGRDDSNN